MATKTRITKYELQREVERLQAKLAAMLKLVQDMTALEVTGVDDGWRALGPIHEISRHPAGDVIADAASEQFWFPNGDKPWTGWMRISPRQDMQERFMLTQELFVYLTFDDASGVYASRFCCAVKEGGAL